MCSGYAFRPFGMCLEQYVGHYPFYIPPDWPRAGYLAMRNDDGRKAYCSYCGRRASWEDGKTCPSCGAVDVELK